MGLIAQSPIATGCLCLVLLSACAERDPQADDTPTRPTAGAAPTSEPIRGEQLLANAPDGWQQTAATKTPALRIAEFIPADDHSEIAAGALDDWREKVTFESLSGDPLPDPIEFVTGIGADQADICEGFEHVNIQSGFENNYPTSVRLLTCLRNKATQLGQVSLIKAIQGNEHFYVITRSKRVEPIVAGEPPIDPEEMATWATYLRTIRVCDSERARHPCP
jgi:hypothetical protein